MATELLAPPGTAPPRIAARPARPRPPRRALIERAFAAGFGAAETAFAVAGIFLLSQALVPLLLAASGTLGGPYEGNPVLRTMFAAIHAISLGLVIVHWRPALPALLRRPEIAALVVLALASAQWSAAPDVTVRRAFALLGTTAFGLFLASRFTPRALLGVVAAAFGLSAVLSLVFAIAMPAIGIDHFRHPGAWQGVYTHKNSLGGAMVTGAVAFLLLRGSLPRARRWIASCGLGLCLFLLLMCTSKTALTVLLVLFAATAVFRTLRWRLDVAVMVLIAVVLVGGSIVTVVVANWEPLLTAMGKDPSLTGRVPMWEVLARTIGERPWLGHGYNAFWLGHTGPSAAPLREIGWEAASAHNGFLEVGLQLGLVGLALLLAGYVASFRNALAAVRRTTAPEALWPALLLTMVLLYNFSESLLLERNNVSWVLYVAAVCSPLLARPRAVRRARHPSVGVPPAAGEAP